MLGLVINLIIYQDFMRLIFRFYEIDLNNTFPQHNWYQREV